MNEQGCANEDALPPREDETRRLLRWAADEITMLRGINERLAPKAEAYDSIAAILRLLPQRPMGMGEDLVWRIQKHLDEPLNQAPERTSNGI